MENKLAENIRTFRKQRALTQEQLAEVLGVTVGAVYKWEARLSQPELSTIMELADFFDTSVDVLLGYELKDNSLRTTAARLKKYQSDKDEAGLAEAEKALKKYPNSFEIVFNAAGLFSVFGARRKKAYAARIGAFGKKQAAYCAEYEPADKRKHTVRKHRGGAAHNGRSRTRR